MSSFVINPYRFAAASAFVPTDISGLQLWLDATTGLFDATTGGSAATTDASAVARWEDQSGNAYHVTQSDSGRRPILKTNQQNGLNVLRFDGASNGQYLFGASNFSISGGTNRSVFTVFKRDDANLRNMIAWGSGATGALNAYTPEYFLRFAGTTKGYTNQGTNGSWTIWSVIADGSTLNDYDAYFDGGGVATANATLSTGTTINTTSSALYVGTSATGPASNNLDGDLAEVLIYDSALSTSDREAVRDYLNAKWAVY
jgi:hypothetical protein